MYMVEPRRVVILGPRPQLGSVAPGRRTQGKLTPALRRI
jgi:hypothetical protein